MNYRSALAAAALMLVAARSPEDKLAKALEGRVAGQPVDCINQRDIRSTQIIDRVGILYDVGRTMYLNRPRSGANFLDWDDILVTRTTTSQLCSLDLVRLVDRGSHTPGPMIGLGKFVPYMRPERR